MSLSLTNPILKLKIEEVEKPDFVIDGNSTNQLYSMLYIHALMEFWK